jgi:hypothetical protein
MVQGSGVFQRAADYFKAHPELTVTAANWTTLTGDDEGERFALVLSVVPPAWLNTYDARRIHPKLKQQAPPAARSDVELELRQRFPVPGDLAHDLADEARELDRDRQQAA